MKENKIMKEFNYMNKIILKFENSLTELHGNEYGQTTYIQQIKDKIDWNDKNIIKFPDNIEGVAISFAQGLSRSIFEKISKSEFLNKFDIEAKNDYLRNRIIKSILY